MRCCIKLSCRACICRGFHVLCPVWVFQRPVPKLSFLTKAVFVLQQSSHSGSWFHTRYRRSDHRTEARILHLLPHTKTPDKDERLQWNDEKMPNIQQILALKRSPNGCIPVLFSQQNWYRAFYFGECVLVLSHVYLILPHFVPAPFNFLQTKTALLRILWRIDHPTAHGEACVKGSSSSGASMAKASGSSQQNRSI